MGNNNLIFINANKGLFTRSGQLFGPSNSTKKYYPEKFVSGDIIGVIVNTRERTCSYTVNGKYIGDGHKRIQFPVHFAVSVSHEEAAVQIVGDIKYVEGSWCKGKVDLSCKLGIEH